MPSGKTHNKATLITAVAATAASYIYQPLLGPESLAVIAGCMSGLLLTPDHDVDSGNRSHKLVRGAFGRLPAWLWARIWHAYAVVVDHREWLSHAPVLGTLGRVLYLYTIATVVLIVPMVVYPTLNSWYTDFTINILKQPLFWYWLLGLVVVDTLHFVMDVVSTEIKIRLRRLR